MLTYRGTLLLALVLRGLRVVGLGSLLCPVDTFFEEILRLILQMDWIGLNVSEFIVCLQVT